MLIERDVLIPAGDVDLAGDLAVPDEAIGVVLFAHGSGSGRHSPRNRAVAEALQRDGLGTLLLDLLPEAEEVDLRFDIDLLAGRLEAALDWLAGQTATQGLPVGLFGASTGAAAALVAAADRPDDIGAVVSRGGRPDLAAGALAAVAAPTLLVVGGWDEVVLELNQVALDELATSTAAALEVIPRATHLFEEPGALERVSELAAAWFVQHLRSSAETLH